MVLHLESGCRIQRTNRRFALGRKPDAMLRVSDRITRKRYRQIRRGDRFYVHTNAIGNENGKQVRTYVRRDVCVIEEHALGHGRLRFRLKRKADIRAGEEIFVRVEIEGRDCLTQRIIINLDL